MADEAKTGAAASAGGGTVDPTLNVRELVVAAMTRQDDLRGEQEKLLTAKLHGHIQLVDSKLDAIAHEFDLVEGRRQEQKVDTKTAVDAALSAAKDAVKEQAAASEKAILKSETGAVEQSKANAVNFNSQLKAVDGTLSDLKERVVKIESMKLGGQEVRSTQRLDMGALLGVLSIFISLAVLVTLILKG